LRVIHIATAFPRSEDDVITPWLVELVRRQRATGVAAEVLTSAYRGLGDQTVSGIPVHRFRFAPKGWETLTHDETVPDVIERHPTRAALVAPYLLAGMRAAWAIGKERPTVAHVHWPMPHALFGASMRSGSGGRTALVSSFYAAELNWTRRRLPWLRGFVRWCVRTSDATSAISSSTADLVRELGGDPAVIPFGAALEASGEDGPTAVSDVPGTAREPLSGGPQEPLRLLFVGRLVERKGVEYLVRAAAALRASRAVSLTVVGEGRWEDRIRAAVADCDAEPWVRLAGRVPADELRRLYATADIFVLPAVIDAKGDTEGLGVVLLEAMRFGRPVVGSAVGGIPDIIEGGRTGWLVPPADAEALAATLSRLASDPEATRRVARQGRTSVLERFSWDRILSALSACYQTAIDARRHR
jgi:glycosyltransferase involved in cell wall biosynthesis